MIRGFIASLLLSAVAFTAQQPPKNRTDSATVSAGISKDQLIAEQQLKDIMSKAELALKAGKTHDALKEYRAAVEMVRKNSTLGAQKKLTLFRGGDGIAVQAIRRKQFQFSKSCSKSSATASLQISTRSPAPAISRRLASPSLLRVI